MVKNDGVTDTLKYPVGGVEGEGAWGFPNESYEDSSLPDAAADKDENYNTLIP